MTITRQGLEQVAALLAIGAAIFAAAALLRRARGEDARRYFVSAGALGGAIVVVLAAAFTVAPDVPTPYVPLTARFAQDPVRDTEDTWAAGKATFETNCAICHGPGALGDGPAAAALLPRPFNLRLHVPLHAPGEVFYWISEGVPGTAMPSWKDKLSETQRWQVIRFIEALAAGRTTAP